MDNLKRRHIISYSKDGYEPVSFEPIEFDDENFKIKESKEPIYVSSISFLSSIKLQKTLAKTLGFYNKYYDAIYPLFFIILSFWSRFYLISLSDIVMWDEVNYLKNHSHTLIHKNNKF
ncbi:Glycosyltransferase Family 39 protein [Glomus cerebriforme]|uniref:Glycosyltransferase Family 39 protein n=1 Tax=Glomus cerebriforme TaxID=658196 RepID=A0A397TWC9_9GLOM|nr:Glycosyltransferase Family 39 protein [Glomus cerebriforme]